MGRLGKVFVTGGTGFIGTRLVNELIQKGHTVHVLRRPTSNLEGLAGEGIRFSFRPWHPAFSTLVNRMQKSILRFSAE